MDNERQNAMNDLAHVLVNRGLCLRELSNIVVYERAYEKHVTPLYNSGVSTLIYNYDVLMFYASNYATIHNITHDTIGNKIVSLLITNKINYEQIPLHVTFSAIADTVQHATLACYCIECKSNDNDGNDGNDDE
jgi:hypothetical protein